MQSKIPARIIQTGKSRHLTLAQRASTASLKCLNPDFEYRFFDDDDVVAFIEDEFPEYRQIFDGFPFRIQKYDFFRYLAVFRFGGFYFDIDIYFASGLDQLLTQSCVFTFEELTLNRYLRELGMDWEIGNYAFGAAAGHPFLEAVIQNCIRGQRDPEWVKPMLRGIPLPFRAEFRLLNTTVGGMLSRTLVENPHLARDVTVLFPDDVCNESSWHQFGDFGVHAQQGSWRSYNGSIMRRLRNLWESRTRRRLLRESLARGKSRSLPIAEDGGRLTDGRRLRTSAI
jgi:inositol phosphorylceramide mannosyltransferase catalytic subunit